MYIEKERLKLVTPEQVKTVLIKYATEYRKLPKKAIDTAAAPYAESTGWKEGTGTLDRLARDLANLNTAIVEQAKKTGGYCRDAAICICSKEPKGNLSSGRHYFNVHFVAPEGGIEMLKIPFCKVCRSVMGLQARDGIDTGFFSSGAIGMSRVMDATDIIFCVLRDAGGVYCQF